jgi:hypothetical protein
MTYLDPLIAREPIKLIQQLQHCPLHLSITALVRVKSFRSDSIELIDPLSRLRFALITPPTGNCRN